MPAIETSETTIWYADQGRGPVALLVHGGLFDPIDSKRFWQKTGVSAGMNAAGYRVIAPDRRFSLGRTTSQFATHSWSIEAIDLAAVLAHARVPRAHVVAGSNGCSAALRLALTVPALVQSLTLCWPAAPGDPQMAAAFEVSAAFVAANGTKAYLELLRQHGVPNPSSGKPGFPWGAALLHDGRLADSFAATGPNTGAATIRTTAKHLLAGDLLRGISQADLQSLAALPVAIVPAEPENAAHPRATVEALLAHLPKARLLAGTPESPRPAFAGSLAGFLAETTAFFSGAP